MKAIKKFYIHPEVEINDGLSVTVLSGSDSKISGYALDNEEADPSKIITVEEQNGSSLWDTGFIEID